jgi:ElaB/YqjD/DUF883 family membrane-anchored ribosome-binding protein
MTTAAKQDKSNDNPGSADYEDEIRAEMAEIRNDILALTKSLKGYGKARANELEDRAYNASDEARAEAKRALKKLGKQVANLEKDMEVKVREHPLQWFVGALGVGLVIAMMMRRDS